MSQTRKARASRCPSWRATVPGARVDRLRWLLLVVALVGGVLAMHGFAEMAMTGTPAAGPSFIDATDGAHQHGQTGSPATASDVQTVSPALTSTCPMTHAACIGVLRGDARSAGAPADQVLSPPHAQWVRDTTALTGGAWTNRPPSQTPARGEVSRT